MRKLFFVSYQADSNGCPTFTGGRHFKDDKYTGEHEWDFNDPNPFNFKIKSNYGLEMQEEFIDLDFSDNIYVSENFLKLLDRFNIKYRAIPYEIILNNNKKPNKNYYVLLLFGRYFLLDKEKSDYVIAKDFYTGQQLFSRFDNKEPVYEKISKFVIRDILVPELFICAENNKLMCTNDFKKSAEENNLKGLSFIDIGTRYPFKDS